MRPHRRRSLKCVCPALVSSSLSSCRWWVVAAGGRPVVRRWERGQWSFRLQLCGALTVGCVARSERELVWRPSANNTRRARGQATTHERHKHPPSSIVLVSRSWVRVVVVVGNGRQSGGSMAPSTSGRCLVGGHAEKLVSRSFLSARQRFVRTRFVLLAACAASSTRLSHRLSRAPVRHAIESPHRHAADHGPPTQTRGKRDDRTDRHTEDFRHRTRAPKCGVVILLLLGPIYSAAAEAGSDVRVRVFGKRKCADRPLPCCLAALAFHSARRDTHATAVTVESGQ